MVLMCMQPSYDGEYGEEEQRYGGGGGLRPARMHSRTVSFADEVIPFSTM